MNRTTSGNLAYHDGAELFELVPSHDASTSNDHVALDLWLEDLTKAWNAAWPKRHVNYSNAHALIITWEDNDIPNVDVETGRLADLIRDDYGYSVQLLNIPPSDPDLNIRKYIDGFIGDHGQQNNLLIVYYAGHARRGRYSGAPPIWYNKNTSEEKTGASLDTANIQSILARARDDSPDVLLIYDCCHSLHAQPINDEPTRAVVEGLFAGDFEAEVLISGPDSFTNVFTHELCEAVQSLTPLSIVALRRGIIDRLQKGKASSRFAPDGRVIRDKTIGKVALTKPVRTTPIYIPLSTSNPKRTIFLAPRNQHV